MKNLVEVFQRNEVLDAIWYCDCLEKNVSDLSVRQLLGIVGDFPIIGQLIFGKYRLLITWGNTVSLSNNFQSDKSMRDSILRDPKLYFLKSIYKKEDYIYILDITTVENFGAFCWKREWAKNLLKQQLVTFLPIIQEFVTDAITDTLDFNFQKLI